MINLLNRCRNQPALFNELFSNGPPYYSGNEEAHSLVRRASTGKPEISTVTMPVRAWFKRAQPPTSAVRPIPLEWQAERENVSFWVRPILQVKSESLGSDPKSHRCT